MAARIKAVLKRSLSALLAAQGRQNRTPRHPVLLILMYHRILPSDHAEMPIIQPGMVVQPKTFDMHLRRLRERFEMVHLGDWLARQASGQALPKKACAITFDDGWRDNYEHAYPLLQAYQAPATIFLVSDMVGTPSTFWPERLARLVWNRGQGQSPATWARREFEWLRTLGVACPFGQRAPTRGEINTLIQQCKRYSEAEIDRMLRAMAPHVAPPVGEEAPDILDWRQVSEMAASGLVRFGSHTRHHVRLGDALDRSVLLDEVRTSREIIEQHTARSAELFCYPNGDFTPAVKRVVQDHYQAACTTQRGWNDATSDRFQLKRIGIHDDVANDETSFLAKLSGWM
jgi:peptidoglycan/xylan/chitin deacetylase (PgdA/CDA1 family)